MFGVRSSAARNLRRVDPEVLQARNDLYRCGAWSFPGWSWLWTAADEASALYRVTLKSHGQELALDFCDDLISLDSELHDWTAFTDEARVIAWTLMHESVLDGLQQIFCRDWVPLRVDCAAGASNASALAKPASNVMVDVGFQIERTQDGLPTRGRAHFAKEFCASLLARAQRYTAHEDAPPPKSPSPWTAGRVEMHCVIDTVRFSAADFASLHAGCLILLDNKSLARETAQVNLVFGPHVLLCEFRGTRLLVLATQHQTQGPVSTLASYTGEQLMLNPIASTSSYMGLDEPTSAAARPNLARLQADTLPVTVSFQIGGVTLPLSDVCNVQPGFVFSLPQSLGESDIALFANGTQVGAGRLVCIGDDTIGVQVTALNLAA